MICNQYIQLDGINIHQLLLILTEYKLTPHRKSDLEILKLPDKQRKWKILIYRCIILL